MNTPLNKVQTKPFQIASDQTMQSEQLNDSQTTDSHAQNVKRAIRTATAQINEATTGKAEYDCFLGDTSRVRPDGENQQAVGENSPSPEIRREHAKKALRTSTKCVIQALRQYGSVAPVTVALDITTVDTECWIGPETKEHAGTKQTSEPLHPTQRVATLTAVTTPVPITLAVVPLRTPEDAEPIREYSEIARTLLDQARDHVTIDTVLASRAFNSADCVTEFEQQDVQYLIPARKSPRVKSETDRLAEHGVTTPTLEPDVEVFTNGNHQTTTSFVYIPIESEAETLEFTPFLTNADTFISAPESLPEQFNQRSRASLHARLLRHRIADRLLPEAELSPVELWISATETNAYQLARILLSDSCSELDIGPEPTFAQFIAFVEYNRQFGEKENSE